jgi:hypothetical protein
MSLTSFSYCPKLTRTKSFGSHLASAEAGEENSSYQYPSSDDEKKVDYSGETSPLLAATKGADESSSVQLNATLLTTIFVITVGSSLQFGYGTGTLVHERIYILSTDSNDDLQ